MSDERSAFESGFLGEQDAPTRRTGEYQLGDATAELLARERAPELEPPDELTIKRRMRALKRDDTNPIRLSTRVYPLAAAAVVAFVAILGVTQFWTSSGCGELADVAVVSCGENHAATLASIDRAYPGTTLVDALRSRPPIVVPVHRLGLELAAAQASFAIVRADAADASTVDVGAAPAMTHGLVLTTQSEQEFDRVQSSLAESDTTVPVADELARLKKEEQPSWGETALNHTVVSLVNLN